MRGRGWLLLGVSVLIVAVPAGLLVWLRSETSDRLSELEPEPVPLVLPVEVRQVSDQQPLSIETVWGEAPVVVAPAWSGTVAAVEVASGDVVASGDPVVQVDGVTRVAVATVEPFWRPLARRDSGQDVAALQEWLARDGLYNGEIDGVFGSGLAAAVKAWAESIGVAKPDGTFDPSWVLWLPEDPFVVSSVEVGTAMPAPGAGSPVLRGAVPLQSATLRDQGNQVFAGEGQWTLLVEDAEIAVVDGELASQGMETLADVLDPEEPFAPGEIRRVTPVEVLEVPATAVVANARGETCVFVPDDSGGFVPREVTLAGGGVSRVDVADGLGPGDQVLMNPQDLFDSPTCP
jgi:peptidoglycan hydrolase-like protein with peptidoglycan-binding domain